MFVGSFLLESHFFAEELQILSDKKHNLYPEKKTWYTWICFRLPKQNIPMPSNGGFPKLKVGLVSPH